jgi:site-specific DNA-methyltransferase (adenine-specific)
MKPIFRHDRVEVYHGECIDVMTSMPEASVDSIITDPPYGLGFMGKAWDHGLPGIPFWKAALRVAKPGAILLAFGGTRTHHRLAVAIEDAGWEIRDSMLWMYGSGFPKSLNISKQIDKAAGAKRGKKIIKASNPKTVGRGLDGTEGATRPYIERAKERGGIHEVDDDTPITAAAAKWHGWGTALKPAFEPIVVAIKPLDGTYARNAVEHGVAGLWIDGGKVGTEKRWNDPAGNKGDEPASVAPTNVTGYGGHEVAGRWPANVILSHSPDCVLVGSTTDPSYKINRFRDGARPFGDGAGREYEVVVVPPGEREVWACVPGCPVRMLDGQSSIRTSGSRKIGVRKGMGYHGADGDGGPALTASSGGASRFFYTAKASNTERVLGCPPGYVNRHPTVKPLDLCRYLCRLTRTPTGGVVLDPFSGSGSVAVAALLEGRSAIAIELEEESARATATRVQAALEYGNKLQSLKKYKLPARKSRLRRVGRKARRGRSE